MSSCADRFLYTCPLLFRLSTSFSFTQIFSQFLLLLFTDHCVEFSAQIPCHNSCPAVVWSLHGCFPPLSPSEPTRGEEHLDLPFTCKKEEIRDVVISGSHGYSNCEIKKFKILQGMRKESRQVQTLDFRQAEFGLLRELVGVFPSEATLKGKVARGSWEIFKDL